MKRKNSIVIFSFIQSRYLVKHLFVKCQVSEIAMYLLFYLDFNLINSCIKQTYINILICYMILLVDVLTYIK